MTFPILKSYFYDSNYKTLCTLKSYILTLQYKNFKSEINLKYRKSKSFVKFIKFVKHRHNVLSNRMITYFIKSSYLPLKYKCIIMCNVRKVITIGFIVYLSNSY